MPGILAVGGHGRYVDWARYYKGKWWRSGHARSLSQEMLIEGLRKTTLLQH